MFFIRTFPQVIDYSALKPVCHAEFQGPKLTGLCVSREWLLLTYRNHSLCVYSLPELRYRDQLNLTYLIGYPRADRAGLVYAPANVPGRPR